MLFYLYEKKKLLLANCDINSFLFSDVQHEPRSPQRLLSSEATKMINFLLFALPMFLMYLQIF